MSLLLQSLCVVTSWPKSKAQRNAKSSQPKKANSDFQEIVQIVQLAPNVNCQRKTYWTFAANAFFSNILPRKQTPQNVRWSFSLYLVGCWHDFMMILPNGVLSFQAEEEARGEVFEVINTHLQQWLKCKYKWSTGNITNTSTSTKVQWAPTHTYKQGSSIRCAVC